MTSNRIGIILIISVLVLAAAALFVSCGKNGETDKPVPSAEPAPGTEGTELADKDGYSVNAGGVTIWLGDDASNVIPSLGEAINYFEAPSCAFDGIDKIYYYQSYRLYTFPDNGKDRVLSVVFSDDLIATPEGISIGDSAEKVIGAYGDGYEDVGGSFVYRKSEGKLTFIIKEGCVDSIQYRYGET